MKLWNWFVSDRSKAQLIFIGACILSYTHTLNLFHRSGYEGILAHIGTVICELLFLLGITSKTPNRRTRGALIFGGSIVLYSNVSFGLAKGKAIVFYVFSNGMELSEVTLCGILIPALVWMAEWVRTYRAEAEPAQQEEAPPTDAKEPPDKWETPTRGMREPASALPDQEEAPPTIVEEPRETSQKFEPSNDKTPPTEPPKEAVEPSQQDEQPPTEEKDAAQDLPKTPFEWAVYLYEREKEPPSRRELARLARCSEWQARQALAELRKRVG